MVEGPISNHSCPKQDMTLGRPEVYGSGELSKTLLPDRRRPNVKISCSMFSQLLKLISRTDCQRLVPHTGAEYRSKGLSSWSPFPALLFCQLRRVHSLRRSKADGRAARESSSILAFSPQPACSCLMPMCIDHGSCLSRRSTNSRRPSRLRSLAMQVPLQE